MNALAPGLVPDFASMKPEDARANIDRAMEMAKEWMDIPRVIEPEDMMDPNVSTFYLLRFIGLIFVIARLYPVHFQKLCDLITI